MKKHLIVGAVFVVALLVAVGGTYLYLNHQKGNEFGLGTYGYRCGDGTEFTMEPSSNMERIHIIPATSVERIPEATLKKVRADRGARYEGEGMVFHAKGEMVELSTANFATACLPMQVPGEAPFNFGD